MLYGAVVREMLSGVILSYVDDWKVCRLLPSPDASFGVVGRPVVNDQPLKASKGLRFQASIHAVQRVRAVVRRGKNREGVFVGFHIDQMGFFQVGRGIDN